MFGMLTIYSASFNANDPSSINNLFGKYLGHIAIGLIAYFVVLAIDVKWLKEPKFLLVTYLITIGLLVYVKFFGESIANTNRWIQLGPLNIQPSELAKITVVIVSSAILGMVEERGARYSIGLEKFEKTRIFLNLKNPRLSFNPFTIFYNIANQPQFIKIVISFLAILPILLLTLIQPSLGNTVLLALIWMIIAYNSYDDKLVPNIFLVAVTSGIFGLSLLIAGNYFVLALVLLANTIILLATSFVNQIFNAFAVFLVLIGMTIAPISGFLGWNYVLQDYQKARIEAFVDPQSDPQGAGWQVKQSQIAIGSGRIFGKGYLKGTQSRLGFLPFSHTDFAFAGFVEQFGFVGATMLISTFSGLLLAILRKVSLISPSKKKFSYLLHFGVYGLLLNHVVISILINFGYLPVSGIPLPFISYGGSMMIVVFMGLALVSKK